MSYTVIKTKISLIECIEEQAFLKNKLDLINDCS